MLAGAKNICYDTGTLMAQLVVHGGSSRMDSTPAPLSAGTLGQRLRQARRQRGLTQEALAAPEFTKSYVSAVERGRARPSLKALELLAQRLQTPVAELLAAPASTRDLDRAALEEDFIYQLDCARRAIDTVHPGAALALLATAEHQARDLLAEISNATRYRLAYLRALAYLGAGEPAAAHAALEVAEERATALGDAEAVERVRNLVGNTYYQQNLPQMALELHMRCLQAIQHGVVRDPNLQLQIYSHLANDYWALGDPAQAIAVYQEALTLLDQVSNLERQAGIYWGLSMAYRATGDLLRAQLYARRALDIYEATENQLAVAQMDVNLARILIERANYAAAEAVLDQARQLLTGTHNALFLSTLYQRYTDLELQRGRLAAAAAYARQALDLSEPLYLPAEVAGGPPAPAHTLRTYACALQLAGQVAAAQGDTPTADSRFAQALHLTEAAGLGETAAPLAYSYAEILAARGQHEQAAHYYRKAWNYHPLHRSH
jgi:tetratricopeptide (TPR) repeat protein